MYRLGLDIGTTSVGWAVLNTNNDAEPDRIIDLGVRIFDAAENPKDAADILMEAAPELESNSELVYASQEYLANEYIADAARWGEFDSERWAAFFEWLNEKSLLEDTIDPNHGFTNDYLPE